MGVVVAVSRSVKSIGGLASVMSMTAWWSCSFKMFSGRRERTFGRSVLPCGIFLSM